MHVIKIQIQKKWMSELISIDAWALSKTQRTIPVISAGSGKSQHVTQSLLDFGAAHLGAMHFIARAVARPWSATAQVLYSAASGGVGLGLGLLVAGQLYARFGFLSMLAMALVSTLALAGFVWLALRWRGRLMGPA